MSSKTAALPDRPPRVAIVGRPNVGKSTLFNRLVGGRRAIVTDEPGATRDRLEGAAAAGGTTFRLIDTGGIVAGGTGDLDRAVTEQALRAAEDAEVVLLVIDARQGIVPLDREVAGILRVLGSRVRLVANKVDGPAEEAAAAEGWALGLGPPVPISAEHGLGIDGLIEVLAADLRDRPAPASPEDDEIRVAIIGRPNVGKSSLLNRLLGEPRVVVSDRAGTTRDAVDSALVRGARRYRLVDTAGIRRASRTIDHADRVSILRARRAVVEAHVAVVVLDATAGVVAQDLAVIGVARAAHRPMVLAVNKWDLVEKSEAARGFERRVRDRVRFAPWVPVVFLSALTGRRTERLLAVVDEVDQSSRRRVSTGELNRCLALVTEGRSVPGGGARAPRLFYAAQTGERPPRFVLFVDRARHVHFSFRRFLENRLREAFDFGPTPLVLEFRDRPRRGSAT